MSQDSNFNGPLASGAALTVTAPDGTVSTVTLPSLARVGPYGASFPDALPPVINSFTANPTSVPTGDPVSLNWATQNAAVVKLDEVPVTDDGGTSVTAPAAAGVYTHVLKATAPGQPDAEAAVTITAVAPPTATLTASPTTILQGNAATLTWGSANADTATLNGGAVAVGGTATVRPAVTTAYTFTATGLGGTATATAAVTVTPVSVPAGGGTPPTSFLTAVTGHTVKAGNASDSTVWSTGHVPTTGEQYAVGHAVVWDLVSNNAVDVLEVTGGGTLSMSTSAAKRLTVGTLSVVSGGTFKSGDDNTACPAGTEIVFADLAIDTATDPEQYGRGLVVQGTGQWLSNGGAKTASVKLAADVGVGDTTLTLAAGPTGWAAGDKLVLPDVRPQKGNNPPSPTNTETVTVQSVSGITVTLTGACLFAHAHVTDPNTGTSYYPHVINLTRGVVYRSANPAGVRGHVLFTGRAWTDHGSTEFRDLGRTKVGAIDNTRFGSTGAVTHVGTNQDGRFAWHAYKSLGPATPLDPDYQWNADHCSFWNTTKLAPVAGGTVSNYPTWATAVNQSHWGSFVHNVVYAAGLYGFGCLRGTEYENTFDDNVVVTVGNGSNAQGGGFRFLTMLNHVTNNSMYDCRGTFDTYGGSVFLKGLYSLFGNATGFVTVPAVAGDGLNLTVNVFSGAGATGGKPILEFSGNTAFGCSSGFTFWWVNDTDGNSLSGNGGVFLNTHVLNCANYGEFEYAQAYVTHRGLVIVSPFDSNKTPSPTVEKSDYVQQSTLFEQCSFATLNSYNTGWALLGDGDAVRSGILTGLPCVYLQLAHTRGQSPAAPPHFNIFDGCQFNKPSSGNVSLAGWQALQYSAAFPASPSNVDLTQDFRVYVLNYVPQGAASGTAPVSYQVYLTQQASGYVPPATDPTRNLIGCTPPLASGQTQTLTNWQIAALRSGGNAGYKPVCGAVAPNSAAAVSGVDGLCFVLTSGLPADALTYYQQCGGS